MESSTVNVLSVPQSQLSVLVRYVRQGFKLFTLPLLLSEEQLDAEALNRLGMQLLSLPIHPEAEFLRLHQEIEQDERERSRIGKEWGDAGDTYYSARLEGEEEKRHYKYCLELERKYNELSNQISGKREEIHLLEDSRQRGFWNIQRTERLQFAFACFAESARLGDTEARWNLGWRYALGEGTQQQREKAILWWYWASQQEHSNAASHMHSQNINMPQVHDAMLKQLSSIPDNADNIRRLVAQIQSPLGVVPFVGAGMSIPLGFPGWSQFLLEQADIVGAKNDVQDQLSTNDFEQAAEVLLERRGYLAFHDAITNKYGSHNLENKELTGPVMLIPHLCSGPVVTTNFDHVLEEVFKQEQQPFDEILWGAKPDLSTEAFHQNRRVLIKIHGDARTQTDRVITRADYRTHYLNKQGNVDLRKPLPKVIELALLHRPLLFLGCSLESDRTVSVIQQTTAKHQSIAHYAITEQPLDNERFIAKMRFFSNHNIRPIWFPNSQFEFVELFLSYLVTQCHT